MLVLPTKTTWTEAHLTLLISVAITSVLGITHAAVNAKISIGFAVVKQAAVTERTNEKSIITPSLVIRLGIM